MKGHANFRSIQLQNNFGIKDQAIIREADALFSTLRATEGLPAGNFDKQHLKSIHQHLLGDLYPWAGQFRSTQIQVGDHYADSVAPPALVEMETDRVLGELAKEQPNGMPLAEFSNKMAYYYVKLYAISPFADGNARAVRSLLDAYSEKHGMQIKWGDIPAEAFHAATREAIQGKIEPIKTLFRAAVDFEDLADKFGVSAIETKIQSIKAKVGLSEQQMPSTLSASSENVRRFAGYAAALAKQDLQSYAEGKANTFRDWETTSIQADKEHHLNRNQASSKLLRETLDRMTDSKPATRPKMPGL